jgi:hypothetical protein
MGWPVPANGTIAATRFRIFTTGERTMSQAGVERILGKLLTDEEFRARFFRQPAIASFAAGIRLSPAELEALRNLSGDALAELSRHLDPRVCRLCLNGEPAPDEARAGERDADAEADGSRMGR